MEDHELYAHSTQLGLVINQAKALLGTNLGRYRFFVDSNDRGTDCVYSRSCSRQFHDQQELIRVRAQLLQMRDQIDHVLSTLPDKTSNPSWYQDE